MGRKKIVRRRRPAKPPACPHDRIRKSDTLPVWSCRSCSIQFLTEAELFRRLARFQWATATALEAVLDDVRTRAHALHQGQRPWPDVD